MISGVQEVGVPLMEAAGLVWYTSQLRLRIVQTITSIKISIWKQGYAISLDHDTKRHQTTPNDTQVSRRGLKTQHAWYAWLTTRGDVEPFLGPFSRVAELAMMWCHF